MPTRDPPNGKREATPVALGHVKQQPGYEAVYVGAFPAMAGEYLGTAVTWARDAVKRHGGSLTIVVPQMGDLRSNEALQRIPKSIDTTSFKNMGSGGRTNGNVVILCWPTDDILRKIDGAGRLDALCVLPWIEAEIETWRASRSAVDLLGVIPDPPVPTIGDPVVLAALRSVTAGVNLSSGLTHPLDKPKAVWAFKDLRAAGHTWDAQEIEAWAAANGWPARHASELAQVARDIAAGKQLRAGKRPWRSDVIAIWREDAQAGDGS